MKPSHLSSPRNLADCTFEVGYPTAKPARHVSAGDRAVAYTLVFCAGFLLAYLSLTA